MAEGRRLTGRGRAFSYASKAQKPGELQPEETTEAGTSIGRQDVPRSTKSISKVRGRADFLAEMRAKILSEDSEKNKTQGRGTSQERSHLVPKLEPKPTLEKPREVKFTLEDNTVSQVGPLEKQGEYGNEKTLITNYLRLKVNPDRCVFEYEIRFEPEVDSIHCRYKLVYSPFQDKRDMLCYDGGSRLLTPETITKSSVQYTLKHPISESDVLMNIIFKKKAKPKDSSILYNTLFKNFARVLRMTRFKDKYYDHRSAMKIPHHKLEIWPGFVTSVEEFDGGIQLRCDTNYRILRTDTAYNIIMGIVRRKPGNYRSDVEKALLGECVSTNYNNNLYRVDDIDWTKTPTSTFEISNGQTITFMEYYKNQYNIDIKDLRQPLLINRKKSAAGPKTQLICLVPELCHMTGLTDKMTSDVKVMKDVALYTRVTPTQRTYTFLKFIESIKTNEQTQNMLRKWGLTIDNKPVQVKGRNLLTERLIFGNSVSKPAENGDWQKCFESVNVYRSVDLVNWFLLYPNRELQAANNFLRILKNVGPGLGIDIAEPQKITLYDDKNETYVAAMKKHINRNVQILVCICPTSRDDRYSIIKKFCCKEVPIPSQVINSISLAREDRIRSVVQNIALQMNVKLGGANWAIHVPFKNTMICGVDVYHDKAESVTVAGFVASCNLTHTEWFSKTVFQGGKQEITEGLISSFNAALKYYYEKNGQYPERIVVFRDGLSDGQMLVCKEFEIAQFVQVCKAVMHGVNPKFTFVVVRKRISTKIFQMTGNSTDNLKNPTPGDVVDGTITRKSFYDFFLVSQHVRVGTATPSHYVVLYDNSNMKPDHIQRLTYKFCHLYYNWAGTIRVPAPCFYAHKLAFLVGQNVRTLPDNSLDNKLYYL